MTTRIIVSLTDDGLAALADIVQALEDAGMSIEEVHDLLGTVTGSADPAVAPILAQLPGVLAVEHGRDVGIPRVED